MDPAHNALQREANFIMHHSFLPIFQKYAVRAALSCAVFALALDFSHPAFAYLDPGTGSIILQLLLGGVADRMPWP